VPFLAAWESNFLSCFSYHWHSKLVRRTCTPMFLAQNAWVSQARRSWEPIVASLPVNFPFSSFCRRFLLQTSVGLNTNHTFLSHKNPWTDTFLRDLGLAQLRSTAWVWNPHGTSKLVNRLIDACLMTAKWSYFVNSLCFIQDRSAQLVRRQRRLKAKVISLSAMTCTISCLLVGVGTCVNFWYQK
jgi:hypothetical protein